MSKSVFEKMMSSAGQPKMKLCTAHKAHPSGTYKELSEFGTFTSGKRKGKPKGSCKACLDVSKKRSATSLLRLARKKAKAAALAGNSSAIVAIHAEDKAARDNRRNADGDLPDAVARKKAKAAADTGNLTALTGIRAKDKAKRDNRRDANGDLPHTVLRNQAKAAALAGDTAAIDAIRAKEKAKRDNRIARWKSEADEGNEEAIAKLAAYHEQSVPVVISKPRWGEIICNVTRLLEHIDSPELRIKEAEERVERIFSPDRAANFGGGASTFVFAAGLAHVIGDDGCASPEEARKKAVGLPHEVAEYPFGTHSAFTSILRMTSGEFVRGDSHVAFAIDD